MSTPPTSSNRAGAWALVLAACVLALLPVPRARSEAHAENHVLAQRESLEYAVKATYLYKFAPFVDWPADAHASPSSAIALCVVGEDPFGDVLDRAVAGQTIAGRAIEVRRFRTVSRASGCHIMYITGSDSQSVGEVLDAVRGTPVLTITNSARRARSKGVIHFVILEDRVRFEIDDQAAAQNGITISSKLLSLALYVRRRA